jgi:hypothetical protein
MLSTVFNEHPVFLICSSSMLSTSRQRCLTYNETTIQVTARNTADSENSTLDSDDSTDDEEDVIISNQDDDNVDDGTNFSTDMYKGKLVSKFPPVFT